MTKAVAHAFDEQPAATAARSAVPWLTVIPLAVVMAYADGFWVVSLRGAVGAIQRSQTPFESWLRESTLLLPVFVFAVLAALTLTLRWFGPVLTKRGTVLVAGLLVVAAGTLTGVVELAASAAYDYHLQAEQLAAQHSMASCPQSCRDQQLRDTLALDVRAVFYGVGILLASNLVLVAWMVALRGGRLDVTAPRRAGRARMPRAVPRLGQIDDLRLLLAAGLVGSAVVHAALVPAQLTAWTAAGEFFLVLAAAQLALAGGVLLRPGRVVLLATAAASLAPLVLWLYADTAGLPFGPRAGVAEQVGLADSVSSLLALGTLLVAVVLLRTGEQPQHRFGSTHACRLALVAVVAATALGVGGSGLAWVDLAGSGVAAGLAAGPG
jgi:hypothetical protein